MAEIDRNLKASLSEDDKRDLIAFLDAVGQSGSQLNLKIVKGGPTKGSKSSRLISFESKHSQ